MKERIIEATVSVPASSSTFPSHDAFSPRYVDISPIEEDLPPSYTSSDGNDFLVKPTSEDKVNSLCEACGTQKAHHSDFFCRGCGKRF